MRLRKYSVAKNIIQISSFIFVILLVRYFNVHRNETHAGVQQKQIGSFFKVQEKDLHQPVPVPGLLAMEKRQCKLPILPLDDPEIMAHIENVKPPKCTRTKNWVTGAFYEQVKDWVSVNGTHTVLREELKLKTQFDNVSCSFRDIIRVSDDRVQLSKDSFDGDVYEFKNSDYVHVSCTSKTNQSSTPINWKSYLASPRSNIKIPRRKTEAGTIKPLNVVMWGHDSLSRNMFIRKLPISYSYLTDVLGGIVLKGYNIVGDGTPQALIPILTGKTELELPEVRKRIANASYVNVYPFVWKDFKEHGYLTGFNEDLPGLGTFQHRFKGFGKMPTDFYMRPYFIASEPHFHEYPAMCIGSTPRHKILINYVKHILTYRKEIPKFVFNFYSELSHDSINDVQMADQDITNFVQDLHEDGTLNNTILIIFSDHGSRFSIIRESQQGKQEERLPMMMFIFPPSFKSAFPTAFKNFRRNSEILTTPFDIHATLMDILRLPSVNDAYFSEPNKLDKRELSLLRRIPLERDCAEARIEPHWCACLQWETLNSSSAVVQRAAEEFVRYINLIVGKQTEKYDNLCVPLTVNRILSATSLSPSDELLKFKQSADKDGLFPDFSDTMKLSVNTLQLKVETVPGFGHFEVSLRHDLISDTFSVQESQISRINKYGTDAFCVEHRLPEIRKYCYCRKPEMRVDGGGHAVAYLRGAGGGSAEPHDERPT